jgi:fibronectin type III domain protein
MRKAFLFASATVLAVVLGCSRGSVPTSPSGDAAGLSAGLARSASSAPGLFGASAIDFVRCLQGATDAACWSGARLGSRGTSVGAIVPSAPTGLAGSASGSTVVLTWSAPAGGDPPTGYIIEAGSASGLANLANFATGDASTTLSATNVPAGSYYVRVRATNSSGTSAASNEVLVAVGGGSGPCTAAPGAPSGLNVVSIAGGTVVLAWNAAPGSPSTYIVEAGSSPGRSNLADNDLGSAATTLTATGVGAGTYYVRVHARNACGTGGGSNEVVVVVGGGVAGAGLSGRWVGTSPDGISVPSAECETAFDLQFDLSQSGTDVSGTAALRVTAVRQNTGNRCSRLGDTFLAPTSGTSAGATFVLRAMLPGNGGFIDFTGSAPSTRMTGAATFHAITGSGGTDIYSGTFATNKQ